jgi:hypothetical protein
MSFGFSLGDFVSLTQLALRTVQNARQACGAHDELYREVNSLHTVLQRLQHEAEKPESLLNRQDDNRQEELQALVRGCRKVLKILVQILEKYNGLSEEKKSVTKLWQKVKFGNNEMVDLSAIRIELSTHTNAITLFLNLLSLNSQGKVETQIGQLQQSINWLVASKQGTMKEGSVFTSYTDDDKSFWRELRRELIKDGYSSSVLKKHKTLIKQYVADLGSIGALDDPPEDSDMTPPSDIERLDGNSKLQSETDDLKREEIRFYAKVSVEEVEDESFLHNSTNEDLNCHLLEVEDDVHDQSPFQMSDLGLEDTDEDYFDRLPSESDVLLYDVGLDPLPSLDLNNGNETTESSDNGIGGLITHPHYYGKNQSLLATFERRVATAQDAEKHGLGDYACFKHWDPYCQPVILASSVFDWISLTNWLYDVGEECVKLSRTRFQPWWMSQRPDMRIIK